jgi:site-specific DNA recombinase
MKKSSDLRPVPTSEQDTGLQETELRQYVESRGWECVVYQDKAQSGAKNDRPALNSMLSDMRRRKFDVVVVWKLDRLARSLKQLLTIREECKSLGVDLVSLRQNIDTTLARRTGKRVGRPALRRFQPIEIDRMRELRSKGTSVRKLASDSEQHKHSGGWRG